ncbi:two-component system regulatory protein YycI [bacterium]|nr:two-component system regulatory protein YycI [bacterium]
MKNLVVIIFILMFVVNAFAFVPEAAYYKNIEVRPSRNIEKYAIRHECSRKIAMRDKSDSSYIHAATQYLAEKADLFLLRDDLKAAKVLSGPNSKHVMFQQTYKGLPIFESTLHVHFDSSDKICLVNGGYIYNTQPRLNDKSIISKTDAINNVIKKIRPATHKLHSSKIVYINNRNSELVPAYSLKIITEEPVGNWLACVDRKTGEIISLEDHIMYSKEVTGKGYVYKDHPDLSDKILEDLLHLSGEGMLKGKWAIALNEDFDEAKNADHQFLYNNDNTHFDEVLVYYNVNQVHDYAKNVLNFDKMDSSPMRATVHVRDNYDNAYFMPWTGGIYFGDGNKFNDLSQEGSVLFHEYGHAMLAKIVSYSGGEAGAINEAQADYIACTMTNDSELGEYVCAKIDRPNIRDMENDTHYPEDIQNEVHHDGKIWGAALWDIRQEIGQEDADQVLHQYKFFLPKYNGKFVGARQAVLKAEKSLYNGKYAEIIENILDARGILAPVDPSIERSRIYHFNNK